MVNMSGSSSHNQISSDSLYYPRCEYQHKFPGTTHFLMEEPDHWGTYFRSTSRGGNSDRISKLGDNILQNTAISNKRSRLSKLGAFKSPWSVPQYKNIFYKTPKNEKILYDRILNYKYDLCLDIWKRATEEKFTEIRVHCENDYPCLMVTVNKFSKIRNNPVNSFYNISISYFASIVNFKALSFNLPIEMVIRASFGHSIPSLSETRNSFRINIGIVPRLYGEVVIESLKMFNDRFLVELFEPSTKLLIDVGASNTKIQKYNKRKSDNQLKSKKHPKKPRIAPEWDSEKCLFDVLQQVGDSSGRNVCLQITRQKKYVDVLSNYVDEELRTDKETDWVAPLRKMLGKLSYGEKVSMAVDRKDYSLGQSSCHEYNKACEKAQSVVQQDEIFWELINDIMISLDPSFPKNTLNIVGLYQRLEEENMIFLRKSGLQKSEDGYGSDSGCEVEHFVTQIDDRKKIDSKKTSAIYSKKVVVSTGMRAINMAHLLVLYHTRSKNTRLCPDTKYMYFETADALKHLSTCLEKSKNPSRKKRKLRSYKQTVRYIDLCHCSSEPLVRDYSKFLHEQYSSISSKEDIVVFDYTSAQCHKILRSVHRFAEKIPIIILVNSGIKNEQLGADINPYGTIRIVTRKQKVLEELIYVLKALLGNSEMLPKELHNVRRAYKSIGATVTNRAVYKMCNPFHYKMSAKEVAKYNRKILEMRKSYKLDISSLSEWTPEKMKFWNSKEVTKAAEIVGVEEISQSYDIDPEKTETLIFHYQPALKILIDFGEMFSNIRRWDLRKISFLGSENVRKLYYPFSKTGSYFKEVEECFDMDPAGTEILVNKTKLKDSFNDSFSSFYKNSKNSLT